MCRNTCSASDSMVSGEDLTEVVVAGIKIWKKAIEKCKQMKMKFTDLDFPTQPSSLYHHSDLKLSPVVKWLRPKQIKCVDQFTRWSVSTSDPRPSDILQGALGNCWFMSSLAVLAERPELIQDILLTNELCPEGVYPIKLCKDGQWVVILIDDQFPIDQFDHMVYSQAKRCQLWVPLIEKAVAKLFGCYESLDSGFPSEGLSILTGAPCEIILLNETSNIPKTRNSNSADDLDTIWAKLKSCKQARFLMAASCGQTSTNNQDLENVHLKLGLTFNHSYSVLDIFEDDNSRIRLIKLKNPWGHTSWRGDWSDESRSWTEELKAKLKPCMAQEGIFWMSYAHFIKFFSRVEVCRIRQHWLERRVSGIFPYGNYHDGIFIWNVIFSRTTEVEICVYGRRSRKRFIEDRDCDITIAVYWNNGTDSFGTPRLGSLVTYGCSSNQRYAGLNVILDKGNYIVVCLAFNHWSSNNEGVRRPYVMAIHSLESLRTVRKIQPTTKYFLADVIIKLVLCKGEVNQIFKDDSSVRVYYMNHKWTGFLVVFENGSSKKMLRAECDFTNSCNMANTRGCNKTVDYILPRHRQVINIVSPVDRKKRCHVVVKYHVSQCQSKPNIKQWHSPCLTKYVSGLHEPRPMLQETIL